MAKKKIKDLESHKFSIDVGGANKVALDVLSENMQLKYGPTLNLLISCFCRLNPKVKSELLEFCEAQYKIAAESQEVAGALEYSDLEERKKQYLTIARLINDGNDLHVSSDEKMKKIAMKDGYLIIPSNWIVLNEEEAHLYSYAGVVECRRTEKYNNVPHFVFFNEYKLGRDYTEELHKKVNEMCVKEYPNFQEILDKQVILKRNPENPTTFLNAEEFKAAPTIGYFHLPDNTEEKNPVCGAVIIRKSQKQAIQ